VVLIGLHHIMIGSGVRYSTGVEIQLTQGQVTALDDVDADQAAFRWHTWKGKNNKTFYAKRNVPKPDGRQTTLLLHQVIAERMGIEGPPDHIDFNGLNNRRSNLRQANASQQGAHRGVRTNNTSGFKGVSWNKGKNKWHAKIMVNGKNWHLGYFDNPIEAAKAYDLAALQYQGEFAVLNFPAPR